MGGLAGCAWSATPGRREARCWVSAPAPGMPRLQAAGRFLAPAGRYFPALLPEGVPQRRLTELALAELARAGAG